MSVEVGSEITLEIEKPAAGGRMLARHEGQVVLVWGTIPGERVRARVERTSRHVLYAETMEVVNASPDRRDAGHDWRCGGNAFAHIAYPRQCALKAEIICDALERIGRVAAPARPDVLPSPEQGYRMRARLHARDGRLGFFREGTHELCDAAATGQLLRETGEWIASAARLIERDRLTGLHALEIAENVRADERVCHLELEAGIDTSRFRSLGAEGLTGLTATRADRAGADVLTGIPTVGDVVHVRPNDPASALRLRRDARAFFQGNRYLLEPLIRHVVALVPPGPVVDMYAGVGLFGLALAAVGASDVTLVEGDPASVPSLTENAEPLEPRARIVRGSVESFLADGRVRSSYVGRVPRRDANETRSGPAADATFIVDPPRTGMSKEALAGVVRARPARIVYVSCDVATFARDTRTLLDAGYELGALTGIDLFPNTAHVEVVAAFDIADR
jgi:tRNA/tmRNA/rRNA uracil-C5-methylase (TrmA/RlmC/RlmD family)